MDAVDDTSKLLAGNVTNTYEDSPSLLTVIIDTHASGWASIPGVDVRKAISSVLVFINAHLALRAANKVAVLSYNGSGASFLYPIEPRDQTLSLKGKMYAPFRTIDRTVYNAIVQQVEACDSQEIHPVSGALSLSMCYTDRILRENPGMKARTCIVSVTEDIATHYIATMNCIFAAQKLQTPIDVCDLVGNKSFLQQATDFTGGIYIKVDHEGLVQYFMSAFSIDTNLREFLNLPTMNQVDFSAVCFNSNEVIDIGYVCSVCLCTMKHPMAECPLCGTPTEVSAA